MHLEVHMKRYRKIPSIAILILIFVSMTSALSDEEIAELEKTHWTIDLELDMPGLKPEVVMWAIFDEDPIPGYKQRLEQVKDVYTQKLLAESDEEQLGYMARAQINVSWNSCFREITGDKVYLLTAALYHSFTSDREPGTKWIVTKFRFIKDEPVCWVIPVELEIGKTIKVVLSEENMFDIEKIYKEVMEM